MGHCCACEIARTVNRRIWGLASLLALLAVVFSAYLATEGQWLGFSGWVLLTVNFALAPIFQRRFCYVHEGRQPPGPPAAV